MVTTSQGMDIGLGHLPWSPVIRTAQYAGREDMRTSNVQTLHSTLQLRHNSNLTLDDTPIAQGGQQVVIIGEHSFNLHFDNGRVFGLAVHLLMKNGFPFQG